jgi:hypothetical protein
VGEDKSATEDRKKGIAIGTGYATIMAFLGSVITQGGFYAGVAQLVEQLTCNQ